MDTKEARDFIRAYIGTRPTTLPLLRSAFRAWREAEKNGFTVARDDPQSAAAAEPEAVPDLESLSDTQIAELHTATIRDRARKIRNALSL